MNARPGRLVSCVVWTYRRNVRDTCELRPRDGVKLRAREPPARRRADPAANRGEGSR
jgi:hypothetical protein